MCTAGTSAAARRTGVVGALPRRAREASGGPVRQRRVGGQGVFDRLESHAEVVAQRLEPGARAGFAGFDVGREHEMYRY
jgi:hypothetical protein